MMWAAVALLLALAVPLQVRAHRQDSPNLMAYVLQQRPVLADLITRAGLTPTLSGSGTYTLLAPPEATLRSWKDKPVHELRQTLMAYILKGRYLEKDLRDGATLETLAGTTLTICRKNGATLVDGVQITDADHTVQNGVIHGLADAVAL